MNHAKKYLAILAIVITGSLFSVGVSAQPDADAADVKALIGKWIADFNTGDFDSFVSACAARTAVVDGFPPYAWLTCADWIGDYQANNAALQATHGTLEIGEPI